MDKKEAKDMLEKMTVEEMFKMLSKPDKEFIRDYIEQAFLKSVSEGNIPENLSWRNTEE